MRRRVKRAVKTVILVVIGVGAIASVAPSTWREAEDEMRRRLRSIEAMARPPTERSADWFERQKQKHRLRDRLGGIEIGAGNAAEVRKVESVRIAGGSGAFTGPARVIDGDTLDVGGVRIRLYGIDAPESKQSCQAGGKRWSCGREATRALAGRIGGRSVSCQERDRDRYGRIVAVCSASGTDLNAWMAVEGWAFAYRRYSNAYVAEESGRGQQGGACGAAMSFRLGIGARASALAACGQRHGKRTVDGAPSRATSARTARALPCAGRAVLRADANQYIERGAVVLHRGRSPGGRVASLKAVASGPAAWSTGSQASVPPRRSWVDESAPLGRYRTVPGARMQLYASRLIQTVELRHIRCRGWAPSL